ncbi:hypothetical protein [Taibaiella helva]|uniref:hypothetical protein n=1 Tax=Taibaiella helva TaxID=2301235 RepID=UPI0013004017|nr:hypothetical protein [Taibaiella helva]
MFRLSHFTLLLATLLLLSGLSLVKAQPGTADQRISEVYGSYTSKLTEAQVLELKARLLRCSVKQMPMQQGEQYPLLSSQPLVTKFVANLKPDNFTEPAGINPLKYNLKFQSREDVIYRIDGTDYVLFVAGKAP